MISRDDGCCACALTGQNSHRWKQADVFVLSVLLVLQAFQLSEQAVTLYKDGWFCPETEPSGVSKMQNPKEPSVTEPIIVVSECSDFCNGISVTNTAHCVCRASS